MTNFKIPAFSRDTKAICVIPGIARWNGNDASGTPFPSCCRESDKVLKRAYFINKKHYEEGWLRVHPMILLGSFKFEKTLKPNHDSHL